MSLDKFAGFGNLPAARPGAPGIASTLKSEARTLAREMGVTRQAIDARAQALNDAVDRAGRAIGQSINASACSIDALRSGIERSAGCVCDLTGPLAAAAGALKLIAESVAASSGHDPDRLPGAPTPTPSEAAVRVLWCLNAVRNALCDQSGPSADRASAQLQRRKQDRAVQRIASDLAAHYSALSGQFERQFRRLDSADSGDEAAFALERRERLAELAAFERETMAIVRDPDDEAAPAKDRPSTEAVPAAGVGGAAADAPAPDGADRTDGSA